MLLGDMKGILDVETCAHDVFLCAPNPPSTRKEKGETQAGNIIRSGGVHV